MLRSIAAATLAVFVGGFTTAIQAATPREENATAIVRKAFPRAHSLTFGQALKMIWGMAGNGTRLYEAGFALDRTAAGYIIVVAPMTYDANMELAIPFNAVGKTVLIAHTHPDEGTDRPTRGDAKSRRGDVYSPVPNYVISRSGLWVTVPRTAGYTLVARRNWETFNPPEVEQPAIFIPVAPRLRKQVK